MHSEQIYLVADAKCWQNNSTVKTIIVV